MPRGHANNGDLAKRRERVSKAIKLMEKIQIDDERKHLWIQITIEQLHGLKKDLIDKS